MRWTAQALNVLGEGQKVHVCVSFFGDEKRRHKHNMFEMFENSCINLIFKLLDVSKC